ncbi:MAG: hypothetical protein QW788_02660, partial [Candidatus Hadarchaeales archaeon]
WSEWMGPDGTPNTLFTSPPADLSFLPPFRYLQVRVFLRSEDPRLSGENGPKVWGIRAEPRPPEGWEEPDGGLEGEGGFWILEGWEELSGERENRAGAGFLLLDSWSGRGENSLPMEEGDFRVLEAWDSLLENRAVEVIQSAVKLSPGRAGAKFARLRRGLKGIVDFKGLGLPIRLIGLSLLDEAWDVEIEARMLGSPPPEVPPLVPREEGRTYVGRIEVYAYLDLSCSVMNGLIEEVEIEFEVPKAWMSARGPGRVAAYHFNGSFWEELPTFRRGDAGDTDRFLAKSHGFSIYAIAHVIGETVYEGGTSGISGAQADDGIYENIFENAYPPPSCVKTVEFFIGQDTQQRTGPVTLSWPFQFYIPEPNPILENIYVEVTTSTGLSDATVNVDINGSNSISHTVDSAGETILAFMYYNAKPVITSISQGWNGPYTLNLGLATATTYSQTAARLIVTYRYDPTSPTQLKTQRFLIGQSPVSQAAGTTQSFPIYFYIPEPNPVLDNIFVIVDGIDVASGATDLTLGVDINGSNAISVSVDDGAEATGLHVLYDAKPVITSISQGWNGPYTLNITNSGDACCLKRAELVVTYRCSLLHRENVEQHITGLGPGTGHVLEIEYYTTGDTEPFSLYLYNFSTGTWDNIGNLQVGGSAASPYLFSMNLTGTNYISSSGSPEGENVYIRYVQPDNDFTQSCLMIDFVRVVVYGPGRPQLLSPENGFKTNDNRPTFSWTPADNHTGYRLVIDNSPDFSDGENVYDNANIPPDLTSLEIENQLPDGVYYWRVAALGAGYENWSDNIWCFRVDTVPPPAPTLFYPDDLSAVEVGVVGFGWENLDPFENSIPVSYYLAISDNSQFPYENYSSGWIIENYWSLALPRGTWYWRVCAKDNAGNLGENSATRILFVCTWSQLDSLTCTLSTTASWFQLESCSGTINSTTPVWLQLDSRTGTCRTAALWYQVDSWTGTVQAAAAWFQLDSWMVTCSSPSYWLQLDSCSGSITSPALWYQLDSWAGEARTLTAWSFLDSWTFTLPAPAYWFQVDSWSNEVFAPSSWLQLDSWMGMSTTLTAWYQLDFLVGSCSSMANWLTLDSWTGGIGALAEWRVLDSLTCTLSTTAFWFQLDSWTGTCSSPASWQSLESLTGTLVAPAEWRQIDSWSICAIAPSSWLPCEDWTCQVRAPVSWLFLESWSSLVQSPAHWQLFDSWTGSCSSPSLWHQMDSYSGTIRSIPFWYTLDSWSGIIRTIPLWYQLDSWACACFSPVFWLQLDSWTGACTSAALWLQLDSWTESFGTFTCWSQLDSWVLTVGAGAQWFWTDSWTETLEALALWAEIEGWTVATSAPASWHVSEGWTGEVLAPSGWCPVEAWTGTVRAPASWQALESWTVLLSSPAFWEAIDGWTVTVGGRAVWEELDTWMGVIRTAAFWRALDLWAVILRSTAAWQMVESWMEAVSAEAVWWVVDGWSGTLMTQAVWSLLDGWTESIQTQLLPGSPRLYRPENNSIFLAYEAVTFEWENGANAENHRIEVDNDENWTNGCVDNVWVVGENSWVKAGGYAPGTYYWRVWAVNSAGENVSENVWYFTVVSVWRELESWIEGVRTSVLWSEVDIWAGGVLTSAGWWMVEGWTGGVQTPAGWRGLDSCTGGVLTAASWRTVEAWAVTSQAPALWQPVEGWTGIVLTLTGWQPLETWMEEVRTPAGWQPLETWTGGSWAAVSWQTLEIWMAAASAPAGFTVLDSWMGGVGSPSVWRALEEWMVESSALAHWSQLESLSCLAWTTAGWSEVETWQGSAKAHAFWRILDSLAGTLLPPVSWQSLDCWSATAPSPAGWQPVESWSCEAFTPISWRGLEGWGGVAGAAAFWLSVDSMEVTVLSPVGWRSVDSWTGVSSAPAGWFLLEESTCALAISAEWFPLEAWMGSLTTITHWQELESLGVWVQAPSVWQALEDWTGVFQAPVSWFGLEDWAWILQTPAGWVAVEAWEGTVLTLVGWRPV